jgi:hypothetical protein
MSTKRAPATSARVRLPVIEGVFTKSPARRAAARAAKIRRAYAKVLPTDYRIRAAIAHYLTQEDE